MNDIQTMSRNYMALLKEELMSRGLNNEQVNRVIKKARFEECLAKFPEESIHYPIESTADEVLQVAAVS